MCTIDGYSFSSRFEPIELDNDVVHSKRNVLEFILPFEICERDFVLASGFCFPFEYDFEELVESGNGNNNSPVDDSGTLLKYGLLTYYGHPVLCIPWTGGPQHQNHRKQYKRS